MAVNPLLIVVLPVLYMLASVLILMQFSVLLVLASHAAVTIRSIKALAPIEPVVLALVDYLTRVFGPPHKFTPQPTHVLLMTVVVALVVNTMRRKY